MLWIGSCKFPQLITSDILMAFSGFFHHFEYQFRPLQCVIFNYIIHSFLNLCISVIHMRYEIVEMLHLGSLKLLVISQDEQHHCFHLTTFIFLEEAPEGVLKGITLVTKPNFNVFHWSYAASNVAVLSMPEAGTKREYSCYYCDIWASTIWTILTISLSIHWHFSRALIPFWLLDHRFSFLTNRLCYTTFIIKISIFSFGYPSHAAVKQSI